ncbi:hypothetical protein DMB38_03500 [Streptomyces sp. WAC 06738]|uniref:hypothetical protein n=1 Tax=Streptomyces sp. WAC 06738 TaxID=2203210 RepID=UPI000F6F537C|nr:hypothetical protein [Streptomyces sp. WAC 06738]AZM45017.1 hypothetical protein DMB38_03500 [Streptomyces sp. WAC 06738]
MFTTTVCAALSAAGLAIALLTAYRRRFRRATKIAALSLVPVGLAMAGLVKLGGKVGKATGDWATDLVFKPSVWGGFGVLAVAVVLWVAQRFAGERAKRKAGGGAAAPAAAPAASQPALGAGRGGKSRGSAAATTGRRGSGSGDEDFSDIEAILKKHGI